MSIESLKEQARRHEQKEEWRKALAQYKKAIAKLDEDDQPDIGLYNRVADLYVRVGDLDAAVEAYEQAVDLYMEAELPNNAIAVLKKVIRSVPGRHKAYLKMGQVRASQGFLPDARANFLTYAERMQQAGDLDESFRALVECCDLAPEDVTLRRMVADQMASNGRDEDAVRQLSIAYRSLMLRGQMKEAAAVEARVRELNPDADLTAGGPEPGAAGAADETAAAFGEIQLGSAHPSEGHGEAGASGGGRDVGGLKTAGSAHKGAEQAKKKEEVAPLPIFDLDEEEEEEEVVGAELPLLDFGSEEEPEEAGEPAETLEGAMEEARGEPEEAEEPAEPAETLEGAMEEARGEGKRARQEAGTVPEAREAPATLDEVRALVAQTPGDIPLHQRFVELAYGAGDESVLVDAYMGLGEALQQGGQGARAKAAFQQVLQLRPEHAGAQAALGAASAPARPVKEVASHEDYVDLGSLILGEDDEKTTRFVVDYAEPSGDEAADFAKMLSQFKEKVSENVGADDVRAHHDLGTAYKEMGLLDEAVTEFQQALRASQDHLPTYELLGQTFMEMGRYAAAVRSLERALEVPFDVEDELLGIYYYLARAYEAMGNTESALEFYDRVFSLDINFADVTERLRALR